MSNIATAKKFPIYTESGVVPELSVLEEQALAFNIADGKIFTRQGTRVISLSLSPAELMEGLTELDTSVRNWVASRTPSRTSLGVDKVQNFGISDSYDYANSSSYASSKALSGAYNALMLAISQVDGGGNVLTKVKDYDITDDHMANLSTLYASSKAVTNAYSILNTRLATANTNRLALIETMNSQDTANLQQALQYTDTKITELLGGAPELLDTLYELSVELNNDTSAIAAINIALAGKASKQELQDVKDDIEANMVKFDANLYLGKGQNTVKYPDPAKTEETGDVTTMQETVNHLFMFAGSAKSKLIAIGKTLNLPVADDMTFAELVEAYGLITGISFGIKLSSKIEIVPLADIVNFLNTSTATETLLARTVQQATTTDTVVLSIVSLPQTTSAGVTLV